MANSEGSAGEICGGKFKSMTKAWSIFAPGLFALFVLGQISMEDPNDPQEVPLLIIGYIHQVGIVLADHRAPLFGNCPLLRKKGCDGYSHSSGELRHILWDLCQQVIQVFVTFQTVRRSFFPPDCRSFYGLRHHGRNQ